MDPGSSSEKPSWWFTGGRAAHQDLFIDLFGHATDHCQDVRQYLILIGSSPETGQPVTPKRPYSEMDGDQDQQDEEALERGRALLRKAWQDGQGYLFNPDLPGRDYTNRCQDSKTPERGVAWYDDLRRTGYSFHGPPADYVPGQKRQEWDDVGGNCVNQWGAGNEQYPFFSRGEYALTKDFLLKTNLRSPLPKWEYCLSRPSDKDRWAKFIFALYEMTGHPAFKAIDSGVRYSSTEVDVKRNGGLKAMGFLAPEWVNDYTDAFKDEEEPLYQMSDGTDSTVSADSSDTAE